MLGPRLTRFWPTSPTAVVEPGYVGDMTAIAGRDYVNWSFAASAATKLVPAGPKASRVQVKDVVSELRRATQLAIDPVAETSGLQAPPIAAPPLVVDRAGWISANVESARGMLGPVLDAAVDRERDKRLESGKDLGAPSDLANRVGGVVTGGEVAGLFAFVSTKVLGQYDLAPQGTPRLLLVAPNILSAERELEVNPSDFRLWVCLHEETHRVQFTAVPWLREHLIESAQSLGQGMVGGADTAQKLEAFAQGLPGVIRGEVDITTLLADDEQREQIAKVTAIMSLLEGHADVVMDEVGPAVIPSVDQIRKRFNERRKGAGSIDVILRRLLGLDAKMKQYRDGAVFVRAVVDQIGRDDFNAIWTSPDTLPLPSEISDPAAWVRRVHG